MKKLHGVALGIAVFMSVQLSAAEFQQEIDQCLGYIPSALTEKTSNHLLQAGSTGVISYFAGSYCMELANTLNTVAEKKNGGKINKSLANTIALLLKTAGYTGKIYGTAAVASIPLRYFLPVIYNTYLAGKDATFGLNNVAE